MLVKNNVYFIPPYIEHTIEAVDNKPYRYQVICIRNLLWTKDTIPTFEKLTFTNECIGEELFMKCQSFNDTHDYNQLDVDVMQFIKSNINLKNIVKKKPNIEIISPTVSYIREHLDEPFNLQKLCNFTHITKFHLIRVFK